MTLEFVTHEETSTLNILLYGPPKVGKTTAAATAPGPILYVNCDVGNATRFARQRSSEEILEVKATGLQTLIDIVHEVNESPTKYGSIVVDPVADLYRIVLEDLSARALSPKLNDYGNAGTHVERFARAICEMPINSVFVLHEMREHDEESGGFERLPFSSTKSGSVVFSAKLTAMVDVVGYCGILEGEGDEEDRYVAQLIDAKGRRGGDRTGALGKVRELDLSEWVRVANEATTTASDDASEEE